jgi:sugar phosphate isomerase/epimerase
MYLTGFADEAAVDLEGQIAATKELGWSDIEARNIDGKNLHDLDDAAFDKVADTIARAGVRVNCFGSAIANWSKSIDQPFDRCLAEAERAAARMQRLGTRLIRIMSYPMLAGRSPSDQMKEERFRRLRALVKLFHGAGLEPVHENCSNYGGMSASLALELVENVPGLKLVFDTGNPVMTEDWDVPEPRPMQSAWAFYERVRDHVIYVHIKDGVWNPVSKSGTYGWPGEGQGDVKRIVKDLLDRGYDGGFSMEPHMKVVAHEGQKGGEDRARADNYVTYGRRFERLLADLGVKVVGGRR